VCEARAQGSSVQASLTIVVRHARRFAALVAIAAAMAFGVAPAIAQTSVTDAQPAPADGRPGPLHLVASSISRVLMIVRSQPADAAAGARRQAEIRETAVELFDFEEMSRRLLGPRWMDASPQEQVDFVSIFSDIVQGAYLTGIGNYPLATITFQGETINGSYAQVRSQMVMGKGDVGFEYHLLERDGRWGVYDIAVDGVSLVSNYRSQFASMLKRMSLSQLLDRLRSREASAAPQQEALR